MSSEYQNLIQRIEELEKDKMQLVKYTGSLNDLNMNGNFAGGPCIDYPSLAGNGWGYIVNLKTSDTETFQVYADKAKSIVFFRFKKSGTWGKWQRTGDIEVTTGTEYETGRIIDNKKEYAKRISFGNLPNATVKSVSTGLSSSQINLIKVEGITSSGYPLPFVSTSSAYSIQMYCHGSGVEIKTSTDLSNQTAIVTIYYIKNNE